MTANYFFALCDANQPLRFGNVPGKFYAIGKHKFLRDAAVNFKGIVRQGANLGNVQRAQSRPASEKFSARETEAGVCSDRKMSTQLPTYLLGHLFTTEEMRAIFSDQRRIQGMLDFESALARALARVGVAPKATAAAIGSKCDAKLFSMETLAQEAALAGNLA